MGGANVLNRSSLRELVVGGAALFAIELAFCSNSTNPGDPSTPKSQFHRARFDTARLPVHKRVPFSRRTTASVRKIGMRDPCRDSSGERCAKLSEQEVGGQSRETGRFPQELRGVFAFRPRFRETRSYSRHEPR